MSRVELGDSIELVKSLEDESIHLILSDIPYGINYEEWDVIHNNTNSALLGKSPAQGKKRKHLQNKREAIKWMVSGR